MRTEDEKLDHPVLSFVCSFLLHPGHFEYCVKTLWISFISPILAGLLGFHASGERRAVTSLGKAQVSLWASGQNWLGGAGVLHSYFHMTSTDCAERAGLLLTTGRIKVPRYRQVRAEVQAPVGPLLRSRSGDMFLCPVWLDRMVII